ncbi:MULTISPECIES: potassium-transporting ATPase subunit KdpA [Bacillus]|uniref:potassium-transporting ATPase subunit KdpA n=1 Tax=Bacillus TaxID=1386 RepID=UPI0003FE5FE1|nr:MULTISPECIES: potassium-transporting ATPase subunit KdpA [Bacillus]QHZ47830.1 potassium-transporting ATPase subunit KdpA [Bacillus sp. NSP9.1]WFA03911.1 potassium-transporting ATPase subunit KdpA [Bacillus sp. HSf4]
MTSLLSICFILLIALSAAKPMGLYIAKVFDYAPSQIDRIFLPAERLFYRIGGVKTENQSWRKYAVSLVLTNTVVICTVYLVFRLQGVLPFNPTNVAGMEPTLAFNTAVSFMTNTNLQHYSGESGLSLLSQMIAITFLMFAAPATALSAAMAMIRGLAGKPLGNFFVDLIRSITRILLPISVVAALVFVGLGVPQTLSPTATAHTLTGGEQTILRGPVASFLSIKELGNNGGGYFGVNSSHPYENPNGWSNAVQILLMLLITISLPFTYGKMVGNKKQGRILFVSAGLLFLIAAGAAFMTESGGNTAVSELGISHDEGSMEGKEVRFGTLNSAFYAMVTTATETGAVNTMHDTLAPLTGLMALLNMMLNTVFGGIGAGFMNMLLYAMVSVFLSGLMVGRTPEFLGKKIEGKEMKLIAVTLLIHPLLILGASALAMYTQAGQDAISNPGFHGISQVLYEYTSSAANNGSGFEGLGDATPFWNITTGIVMFIGRYFSIVTLLAVTGSLLKKQAVPETTGTFRTDTSLFGGIFVASILIVGALTFFPVLVLGPVAEFLT